MVKFHCNPPIIAKLLATYKMVSVFTSFLALLSPAGLLAGVRRQQDALSSVQLFALLLT